MEVGYAAVRSRCTGKAVTSNRISRGGGQKFPNGRTAAVRNLQSHSPGEDVGVQSRGWLCLRFLNTG
jgi:hypothetical protein